MTTTHAHLTNLLKKAQKIDWYGIDHWTVTFGFVYHHPASVDWKYTGAEARALYLEIKNTIDDLAYDDMRLEGYGINHRASIFTVYQSRILDL